MPLIVSTRVLGRRKPLLSDFDVPMPPALGDNDDLRLRDVIEHVVRREIVGFRAREEARRFDRVLSARDIEAGREKGKINPSARDGPPQRVDADEAVATALLAFEDGLYLVVIDGVERRALDEIVRLTPESRVVFVRLTFLAGA